MSDTQVTLRDVSGPFADFTTKLSGENGQQWLDAFKRFLRKENPWGALQVASREVRKTLTIGTVGSAEKCRKALTRASSASNTMSAVSGSMRSTVRPTTSGTSRTGSSSSSVRRSPIMIRLLSPRVEKSMRGVFCYIMRMYANRKSPKARWAAGAV